MPDVTLRICVSAFEMALLCLQAACKSIDNLLACAAVDTVKGNEANCLVLVRAGNDISRDLYHVFSFQP